MNLSMFSLQTLMLGLFGVLIFLVFRALSRNKGNAGIIIYVMGDICLAIAIYCVGIMIVDILIADYFDMVESYKNVTMWAMIVIALGVSFLVTMLDPIAFNLRKNDSKHLEDIPVKDLPDYKPKKKP